MEILLGHRTALARRRARRASALLGAITLLALMVPGGAAAPSPTFVTLKAARGTTVAQGLPLRFIAVVKNPGDEAVTDGVTLEIERSATGERVPFMYWTGSIGPSSSVRLRGAVTSSQWFTRAGRFQIVRSDGRGKPLHFTVTSPTIPVPRFKNVTSEAGLTVTHGADNVCEDQAAGAAWADVDGDGDLDLYLPHQTKPGQLWINQAGSFTDEAGPRGVENDDRVGIGAVFADYDNDGDQDLYVVNNGPNRLYQNDGTGSFSDVAAAAGVAEDGPGSSASWGDYDADGHLDLYVTNWMRCGAGFVPTYYDDALYHNEGDGTFSDQTALLEVEGTTLGAGYQAAWLDYDNDGDDDLYLANDYTGPRPLPNVLWRNDGATEGSWAFTNVSVDSGAGLEMNTMGIGIGDYDRDLDLDIALSNIDRSSLMRNEGNGTFSDVATRARVGRPLQRVRARSVTWAMNMVDLNNDGWEDLYVAGGSLWLAQSSVPPQPNAVFVNARDGRFLDLSAPSRADDDDVGRGVAFADFDRDGRMDMYVVNQGGHPHLFRNVSPQREAHWLEVDTVGTTSNRDGCGARLVAVVDGKTELLREVLCGSAGLASGNDPVVHFGLGETTRLRRLEITWPSGIEQVRRNVRADRLITVTEPAS